MSAAVTGCFGQSACGQGDAGRGPSFAIEVAPLELEGIADASYTITVTNLGGDLVWSRELNSSAYGDGAGGLSYVGPCDASQGQNPNTVTLSLSALSGTGGQPLPAGSWQDPGPIALTASCLENADSPVVFNLNILRSANQGFFDIGVNFADIFCSAKLDCVDALLHDASGQRAPTANIAFACTAGPNQNTTLYWGAAAVVCRDGATVRARYPIDPSLGSGQHGPIAASPSQLHPGIFQSAIYSGTEDFADLDKCYWNLALGLDAAALGPNCTFEATATAADAPFTAPPFSTPPGVVYPIIRWSVPLTGAAGLVCGQHPLNASGGLVATEYAPLTGFPLAYQAGCGELATITPTVADVAVTVSVVDDQGAPIQGLSYVPSLGGAVALPATLTTPPGVALSGHIPACDGTLALPSSAVPRPDLSLTITLPGGQTTLTSTPGTSAITFVIPQYRPVAWWRFDDNTTVQKLARDSVAGWVCENGPAVTRQVPSPVGSGVDLVGYSRIGPPGQLQCYTRLTAGGQAYGSDMRLTQRPWLSTSSLTVEALFENTRLLEAGVNGRLFYLSTGNNQKPRLALHYFEAYFIVYASVGGVRSTYSFNLDGVGAKSKAAYHKGWHHVAVTYDRPKGELRLWLDGVNPDGFVQNLGAGTALDSTYNFFIGGGVFSPWDGSLDEFAIYDRTLSAGLIYQHAQDALGLGRPYGSCERNQALPPTDLANTHRGGHDSRSLAPGYPAYDAQGANPAARTPLQQLQYFQAPRYAVGNTLAPQQSWMGGAYIAGQGTGVTGATLAQGEVNIMRELATFWNYAVKVSDNVFRTAPSAGKNALANNHPEWKTFAIGLWAQISGVAAAAAYDASDLAYLSGKGMALMTKPFVAGSTSQLSLDHFPNDGLTLLDARVSPVSPTRTWELDGKAMALKMQGYLSDLASRTGAGANPQSSDSETGSGLAD